ncbi:hypothetical protein HMPREF9554_00323 [Treponema phagedenis F0421]|nr:hypothetical protein HMPREF9554_00323 [Treponema phagedenis F0421]
MLTVAPCRALFMKLFMVFVRCIKKRIELLKKRCTGKCCKNIWHRVLPVYRWIIRQNLVDN